MEGEEKIRGRVKKTSRSESGRKSRNGEKENEGSRNSKKVEPTELSKEKKTRRHCSRALGGLEILKSRPALSKRKTVMFPRARERRRIFPGWNLSKGIE